MNKVIFSDFTLQNSQLFKWRYMSSIWVRTKSYLWGNNGEHPEVTWPEVTSPEVTWPEETMSGTGSMLCTCATGSLAIPLVGPFHRKWRHWPEVIVCACPTGTFCITTRVVVHVHGYRRGGRVCACPTGSCGIFHRKLATGSDIIFPCIFLSDSTKCWLGVFSTTSASTPFPGYLPLLFS